MDEPRANPPSASAAPAARLGRLASAPRAAVSWVRQKPFLRGPLVVLVVLLIAAAPAGWLLWDAPAAVDEATLSDLIEALEKNDYILARNLASQLTASEVAGPKPQGLLLYVRGSEFAQEAPSALEDDERRRRERIAAACFRQALDQGLPKELWDRAILQAAGSLNRGGRYVACVDFLDQALDAGLASSAEVDRLLASAYARLPNPDWAKALQRFDRVLAAPSLPEADRRTAALDRVEVLLSLERDDEAQKTLEALTGEAPPTSRELMLQARLLVRRAERVNGEPNGPSAPESEAADVLAEAMRLLDEVRDRDAIDQPQRRQADYLHAVCLRLQGDLSAALDAFSAARRLYAGFPSGLAAGLGEAEMLQHLGRDAEALESFQRLLAETPLPGDYSNPWISLDGFRARILAALARWLGQHKYAEALALARALPPVFPPDRAMQLQAETRSEWARRLSSEADSLPPDRANPMQAQARRQFRLAGVAYARLALLRETSREFPEHLWQSAENYALGRDYEHAARMYRLYLDQDAKPRRADAQVKLAESLVALDETDRALKLVQAVLRLFPQHPATYRARLLAAQVYLEEADFAQAKSVLRDNLENESLAPQSLEWRDSLFLLGETLHREGAVLEAESRKLGVDRTDGPANKAAMEKLQQAYDACRAAVDVLNEAVARYGGAPQTRKAKYFLAESHRRAAKYPRKRLPTVALEATRSAIEREMQAELASAVDGYNEVLDLLARREMSSEAEGPATPLSEVEQAMLRNAYFGRADALFDLGRYEEAIRAYTLAANRYQNEPAALEAFVQIAACHRRMGRGAEARGVLEQAKVVLGRIAPDADFLRVSRYGRKQWEELLALLSAE